MGCKSDSECTEDECCVPEVLTSAEGAVYKRGGVSSFWRRSMGMGSSALGDWNRGKSENLKLAKGQCIVQCIVHTYEFDELYTKAQESTGPPV